jgi:PAS domain S-box-containing protein
VKEPENHNEANKQSVSKNDFETIVDISPFPILIHKMGDIRYTNSLCMEMFEVSNMDQIIGRNILELTHPDDRQTVIDAIRSGATSKEKTRDSIVRARIITEAGKVVNTETKSSTINFRGEECRLLVAYNYDHMSKVEEELRNKNLLIEKIADIIPDSLIVVDNQTRDVLFENKPLLEQLGYTPDDYKHRKDSFDFIQDIIHIEDKKKLIESRKYLYDPANYGKYISTEYRIKDKLGKWRWFLSRSTLFRKLDGEEHQLNFGIAQDITNLKETEQELFESKSFIDKITKTIPNQISIFELDPYQLIYDNYYFGELLGYNRENSPENMLELFAPDYVQKAMERFANLKNIKENEVITSIDEYITKEGKRKYLLTRVTPFQVDENGNAKQILSSTGDITDFKEAETKLIRSEKLYKAIAHNLPNGSVVVFDNDLRFTVAEGPLLEKQELAPELILGKTAYEEVTPGVNWNYLIPYFENVLKGKEFYLEVPQEKFFYHILLKPLYDDDGKIYGGMSITLDVKDIKDTQVQLEKSEEKRKAILFALPDMVFQIDIAGRIKDFYPNDSFRADLAAMDFIGISAKTIIPETDYNNVLKLVTTAIETDVMQSYEYIHHEKDRDLHFEFRISRLSDEEAIIIARDVTNLRRTQLALDDKLGELSDKNIQLEKYITSNSELEKFAYIASHDLREPVRSIVGFAQLMQKRTAVTSDSESKEFLQNIIDSAQRMNSLIHGLLDYSRITSTGKGFTVVSLNDVLKKVLSDLQATVEESGAQIKFEDLPSVKCDDLQIRQLFQNLISNSIKFRKLNEAPVISISAKRVGEKWQFTIADNGIGLDMKYKEKVFQIFSRLHSSDKYQGSGIGLSLCKRIVERHGGEIWLESKPGEGTTFYFTIAD